MIDRNNELPVSHQAKLLGISRGSVYYQQKWLGLFEQLFPKDKWSHSWVDVLGKAQ